MLTALRLSLWLDWLTLCALLRLAWERVWYRPN